MRDIAQYGRDDASEIICVNSRSEAATKANLFMI